MSYIQGPYPRPPHKRGAARAVVQPLVASFLIVTGGGLAIAQLTPQPPKADQNVATRARSKPAVEPTTPAPGSAPTFDESELQDEHPPTWLQPVPEVAQGQGVGLSAAGAGPQQPPGPWRTGLVVTPPQAARPQPGGVPGNRLVAPEPIPVPNPGSPAPPTPRLPGGGGTGPMLPVPNPSTTNAPDPVLPTPELPTPTPTPTEEPELPEEPGEATTPPEVPEGPEEPGEGQLTPKPTATFTVPVGPGERTGVTFGPDAGPLPVPTKDAAPGPVTKKPEPVQDALTPGAVRPHAVPTPKLTTRFVAPVLEQTVEVSTTIDVTEGSIEIDGVSP